MTRTTAGFLTFSALWLILSGANASAAIVITMKQVGGDVVVSGGGTADVSGLQNNPGSTSGAAISPVDAMAMLTGPTSAPIDLYSGVIFDVPDFGTGGLIVADSGSGDLFGIGLNGWIAVPAGYLSGVLLEGTSTYANTTIAALGVTPGEYVWTWGDSLTLRVEGIGAAVPEPSSFALLGVGGFVGVLAMRRRRGAV